METGDLYKKLLKKMRQSWLFYKEASQNAAVETLEFELGEMENIFGLLVLGSFIGFPSPPMQITLDLMPEMEKHFVLMLNKVEMAQSPISELLSTFDVI